MNAKAGFSCGDCGDFHRQYDDALNCCQPGPHEAYQCGKCEQAYREYEEAEECCKEKADD